MQTHIMCEMEYFVSLLLLSLVSKLSNNKTPTRSSRRLKKLAGSVFPSYIIAWHDNGQLIAGKLLVKDQKVTGHWKICSHTRHKKRPDISASPLRVLCETSW